jgi:hypothetical protein
MHTSANYTERLHVGIVHRIVTEWALIDLTNNFLMWLARFIGPSERGNVLENVHAAVQH